MPEGDSVYQLSKRLQWMQHREVTATSIRVPRFATVDFTGMTCERVWPYGKHLFMEFSREGHESQVLHTHLKMEGTWAIHRAGTRWRKPGHTARVVLRLADAPKPDIELVGHSLGLVEVFPARDYPQRMGYLGPDMLARDFDQEEVVRVFGRNNKPCRRCGTLIEKGFLGGAGDLERVIWWCPQCQPPSPSWSGE